MAPLSLTKVLAAGVVLYNSFVAASPMTRAAQLYPGFNKIKYMFIFGDSYTTTGFNATTGPQPSASNPLGNPPYPGYTSANGPNWVDYLTVQYNKSLVETYNLAYGGATVDSNLVAQYLPTVLDLQQQVDDEFLPIYGNKTNAAKLGAKWSSSNTLFGIWIGINDVGNSYYEQNATLNGLILKEYSQLVNQLYSAGARNFLFINVPPTDRAPLITAQGASAAALLKQDITSFNQGIANLTTSLKKAHPETTVFLFDSNTLFNKVLDNPQQFPETSLYKNTTTYCASYENGTPAPDTFDPECGIPVNQYFWLNTLHPTYPMQELVAKNVAAELSA